MRPWIPMVTLMAGAFMWGAAAPQAQPALDRDAATHVLNRLGYGPTMPSLQELQTLGLQRWLERQLRPERVDDGGLEARLAGMRTLAMTPRDLADTFYLPARERRRAQQRQEQAAEQEPARPVSSGGRPERDVLLELTTQKLLRATMSTRQLEAVLTDFWFNHFNVFAGKGPLRQYVGEYERAAIRPHVLGSFRDMLGAVAGSPAMLVYLDNWQSSAEGGRAIGRATGLNENYARELLELHTLGVDGGYTQKDVGEVARAFTGWTVRMPRQGGEAYFDARRHDGGARTVLGQTIPAGLGPAAGERVLDLLARHPATARRIARKLAVRFVSDTPPESLVTTVATRFQRTNGDLRETMRALVLAPEFLAPGARAAKVKTPFEFVASAVRALDADVQHAGAIGQQLRVLGMPLYYSPAPTGYSDSSDAWTNGGALVQRMNLAVALTHARVRGVGAPVLPGLPAGADAADPAAAARAIGQALAFRDLSAKTLETVTRGRTAAEMAALVLGAPEFQRR